VIQLINIHEDDLSAFDIFKSKMGTNSDIYIHDNKLLKLINDNTLQNNPDIKSNVEYLINFTHDKISFPIDIAYVNNNFKGYEMNILTGNNLLEKVFKVRDSKDDLSFEKIIKIKNSLLELVLFFSENRILMDDPNISNVLIDNNGAKYTDLDFYKKCTDNNLYSTNLSLFNYSFKDMFIIIMNKNRNINILQENIYLKNMLYANEKNNLSYTKYIDDIISLLYKDNIKTLKELKEYRR